MKIKRIHIIGGPGSGKSYAAEILSRSLKIPYYDLDDLFWDKKAKQYGVKTPEKVRDKYLKKILKKDKWIIEGVYYEWLRDSFSKADIIIVLKTNAHKRALRILKRSFLRKLGLVKSAKKESLKRFVKIMIWNQTFDKRWMAKAEEKIKKFKRKTKHFSRADEAIEYVLKLNIERTKE